MHRKGAQDSKRGKIFSKIGREITVAAKMGAPDPEMNPRLRAAILSAKAVSMPNDNIKRAIEKAAGAGDGESYENIRYEGYGISGVAFIVEALTDNRNRTAGDIRSTFSKLGGNMGETGSVGFMFDKVGQITYEAKAASADAMFEAALDAGADNVESDEEGHEIITKPDDFSAVLQALTAKFGNPESAAVVWKPNVMAPITDADSAKKLMRLIETLEDYDDVQSVATNIEMSDEIAAQLG
mgnify:FL=1